MLLLALIPSNVALWLLKKLLDNCWGIRLLQMLRSNNQLAAARIWSGNANAQ